MHTNSKKSKLDKYLVLNDLNPHLKHRHGLMSWRRSNKILDILRKRVLMIRIQVRDVMKLSLQFWFFDSISVFWDHSRHELFYLISSVCTVCVCVRVRAHAFELLTSSWWGLEVNWYMHTKTHWGLCEGLRSGFYNVYVSIASSWGLASSAKLTVWSAQGLSWKPRKWTSS